MVTNDNFYDLSKEAELQVLLRQALVAANASSRQTAVLQVALDAATNETQLPRSLINALAQVSLDQLRLVLRETDTVTITETGQLTIILPSLRDEVDAENVTQKLLDHLRKGFIIDGKLIEVNPSIGIALFPKHGSDAKKLIAYAQAALAVARQNSNPYAFHSSISVSSNCVQLSMKDLRKAIASDDLYILYQPKISLYDKTVASVESLVRWQHPEFGTIAPDQFIPLAERTGLIIPLTLWVLHQSLLQCRNWQSQGFKIPVAVNLSMWNLEAPELPGQLKGLLQSTGITPDMLVLEITESALMGNPQRVLDTLMRIRKLGITFAIDDFGVGYSSLSYIRQLPVSYLKIDKSFVHNVHQDRNNAVIVRSIVDLSHNLGLKVVAEGVENADAERVMIISGCDEVQGYYYSRPVNGKALTSFIEQSPYNINPPEQDHREEKPVDFAIQNLRLTKLL